MPDPHALALLADSLIAIAVALKALDSAHPAPQIAGTDRWLTPDEAAAQMGVKVRWLGKRWKRLPFCHALPGGARGYRVSAVELQRAMQRR